MKKNKTLLIYGIIIVPIIFILMLFSFNMDFFSLVENFTLKIFLISIPFILIEMELVYYLFLLMHKEEKYKIEFDVIGEKGESLVLGFASIFFSGCISGLIYWISNNLEKSIGYIMKGLYGFAILAIIIIVMGILYYLNKRLAIKELGKGNVE